MICRLRHLRTPSSQRILAVTRGKLDWPILSNEERSVQCTLSNSRARNKLGSTGSAETGSKPAETNHLYYFLDKRYEYDNICRLCWRCPPPRHPPRASAGPIL